VGVKVDVRVRIGVFMGAGVRVGSIGCACPQPAINKLIVNKQISMVRRLVFMSLLRYFGRTGGW
jgi:hypothetical protein